MNFKILTIFLFGFETSFQTNGQVTGQHFYQTAYNYLDDSIINIKANYGDAKALKDDCRKFMKGVRLKFKPELQVANEFIENDCGFPVCDLLKRNTE